MKVFCIGENKTGTTSVGFALKKLGFSLLPQKEFEKIYINEVIFDNYKNFFKLISKYDAFQDIPFSKWDFYKKIYEKYPNERYILTIRDSEAWFNSLFNFHKRLGFIQKLNKQIFLNKNISKNHKRKIK